MRQKSLAKLVTPQGHRDADVILQNLTELSPDEHDRLINDPKLVAQVMSVFQFASPKKREIAERVLGYRKE